MTRNLKLLSLSATFCASVVLAQAGSTGATASAISAPLSAKISAQISGQISATAGRSSSPAAYVYVSRALGNSGKTVVYAFSAAPNGKLTLISDSPLMNDPENMAVIVKYLPGMVPATNESNATDTLAVNSAVQIPNQGQQSDKFDGSVSAGGDAPGPYRVAAYMANTNRPASAFADTSKVAEVEDAAKLSVARTGNLLAVGGAGGLRIFTLNGASPVTTYSGLLTHDQVEQCYWDNDHHLYAISHAAGKLWVFTVTETGFSQAPGSPYKISGAESLVVQNMPW